MAEVKSWEVSDSFWPKVKPLIPSPKPDPNQQYLPKPGAGRKPMPARKILAGIVYVLPTGCQWKALPKEDFGSSGAIHTHFLRWAESGFLVSLWPAGLAEYDEMEGISWKWPSIDEATVKAALAQETVGPNPTDRGKKGSQPNLLVDGCGVPLSLVVSGANRPDVTQLEIVWDEIVIERADDIEQQLCADKGYDGDSA